MDDEQTERDEYLWAEFAREAMGRMMASASVRYTLPDLTEMAASIADAMLAELRKRFPRS